MNINEIKYEMHNMHHLGKRGFFISLLVQLLFFLSFVPMLKESPDPVISKLTNFLIFGSATTCYVMEMYGSVKGSKYVVADYMNDNKLRIYMFPNGRGKLLLNKTFGFISIFSTMSVLGTIIANIIFLVINSYFKFSFISNIIDLPRIIIAEIGILIFLIATIIFSMTIGVRFESKVKTVITALVIVLVLSNMFVSYAFSHPVALIVLVCILLVISLFSLNYCKKYINNDELLR